MREHGYDPEPYGTGRNQVRHPLRLAAVLLGMAGLFHLLAGLADVYRDRLFGMDGAGAGRYELHGWAQAQLVGGALLVVVGALVLTRRLATLVAAGILACASAVVSLATVPYQPLWAALIVGLDVAAVRTLLRTWTPR